MSRGSRFTHAHRPMVVWLLVTSTCGGAARLAAAAVTGPLDGTESSFADLLVRCCAVALLVALAHLWGITTVTVVDVLRGTVRSDPSSATRRMVLLACGVALAAGAAAPATATEGDDVLAGLRLPERAVSHSPVASPPPPASPLPSASDRRSTSTPVTPERTGQPSVAHRSARPSVGPSSAGTSDRGDAVHVVRPGESLWSIAEATSPVGVDLDARWRAIWAANRDVVGADPDLILPGQCLRLPSRSTASGTPEHGRPHQHTDHPEEQGDRP